MILWYIDEAGVNPNERYAVVGGYGIKDEKYDELQGKFREFKKKYLADSSIKIDMKGIIQGNRWAKGLTIEQRRAMLIGFYEFLKNCDLRVILYMIDRNHSEKIRNKMQFAYECLFERVCLNMDDIAKKDGRHLGILFSDMAMNYKEVLSWFKDFYIKGTSYVTNNHLIEQIILLQMSQSDLLQISDMIVCTWAYWLKAREQKSVGWAKEILDEGWKVILKKEVKCISQDGTKEIESIQGYSH